MAWMILASSILGEPDIWGCGLKFVIHIGMPPFELCAVLEKSSLEFMRTRPRCIHFVHF
jgi:hypothetical protein